MRLQTFVAVLCVALAEATIPAQNEQSPSFEVASVRLAAPSTQMSQRITDSRVDLTKNALRQILWMAFQIDPVCCRDRLSAPNWVDSVNLDVHATIPSGRGKQQVPAMLQLLLVQRLGLRFHIEKQPTDVYELVAGRGGIRMKEVEAADELDREFSARSSSNTVASDRTDETVNGRVRTMQIPLGVRTITQRTMYDRTYTARGTQQIDAARMTMPELASILAQNLGRPVLDRTSLTGVYAFSIELPPDSFVMRSSVGRSLNEPTGASASRAVEQLGLRLEPQRIPVDSVVVDTLQRAPNDN